MSELETLWLFPSPTKPRANVVLPSQCKVLRCSKSTVTFPLVFVFEQRIHLDYMFESKLHQLVDQYLLA